ncbi:MAG: glycosyltransferase family 4 protein [Methanobacteriaceae archaeon]
MNNVETSILVFILTFLSTIIFTLFVRKILNYANIRDSPIVTEHRHKEGTPTMGGLAMLLGILLVSCFLFTDKNLVLTALIMITAGIVGLFDDLIGLKIKEFQKVVRNVASSPTIIGRLTLNPGDEARVTTNKAKMDLETLLEEKKVDVIGEVPIKNEVKENEKILAQIVVSLFLVITGAVSSQVLGFQAGLFIIPVVIFGIIGSINAVNLIDGMDGLAAGIVGIASIFCAFFGLMNSNITAAVPFVAIAGVSFGFLVFNRYPASIFMGDTGSFALGAGYITAGFLGGIIYFALIALAIPIISVMVSLIHRAHIIKLPVEPLHHTLHYKGLSEKKIVVIYWTLTLLICIAAFYTYQIYW